MVCVGFLIATVVLVMLFGGGKMPRVFSSDYEVYVLLKQAPMLSENSPVYKNGVSIGRVTRVRLVNDDREVEITTRINGNIKLYTNEDCNLSLNLLGQSTLNFTPKADQPLGEVLPANSIIYGVTPIDIMRVADALQSDASKALRSVADVADEVKVSLKVVNGIIGSPEDLAQKQKQIEELIAQAAETMTLVNRVLGSVSELISDQDIKEGFKVSSKELPGVIAEGKKLMIRFNEVSDTIAPLLSRLEKTIGKVDTNLDNVSAFTEALGDNGPQIAEALAAAAQELKGGLAQLSEFTRSLSNPDGSIGQLLNDPEFFQSLKSTISNADRTIKNVERLTVQAQPILQDVNVFSDKIAREPGLLGLKGVFDKSPPTKGIPDAYANTRQLGRNNGIPQQQSERIRLFRPRNWPFGGQPFQYRNEPVPQQNRYASQVIDLPDSPYDDMGYDYTDYEHTVPMGMYPENLPSEPVPYTMGNQLRPQTPQRDRVVIVPVRVVASQNAKPVNEPLLIQAAYSAPQRATLEIDFTPEESSQVRLASGNVSSAPPIIQPLQGKTEPAKLQDHPSPQAAVQATVTKPERRSEIKVPNYQPTF